MLDPQRACASSHSPPGAPLPARQAYVRVSKRGANAGSRMTRQRQMRGMPTARTSSRHSVTVACRSWSLPRELTMKMLGSDEDMSLRNKAPVRKVASKQQRRYGTRRREEVGHPMIGQGRVAVPLLKLGMPVANGVDRSDDNDTARLCGAEEYLHKRDHLSERMSDHKMLLMINADRRCYCHQAQRTWRVLPNPMACARIQP